MPYRAGETPNDGDYDTNGSEDLSLFFAHQTIQNACGTQAILSILMNKDNDASQTSSTPPASDSNRYDPRLDIGSQLRCFKEFTAAFPPSLRGEALSNSSDIRQVHNQFARSNPFVDEGTRDSSAGTEDVFHFIAYVPVNGQLYELDGLQPHPITHGPCTSDTETFAKNVVPVLRRRIERYPLGEIRFNLLAVTRDLRTRAQEMGDWEVLQREEEKRAAWEWENTLRRENMMGFAGELLKSVAAAKVKEGEGNYEQWLGEARSRTKKRREEKGAGGGEMEVD